MTRITLEYLNSFYHSEIKNDDPISGIYFLYYKNKLVYIGQSINIIMRLWSHRGQKLYDNAIYFNINNNRLLIEKKLIEKYKPIYNARNNDKYIKNEIYINNILPIFELNIFRKKYKLSRSVLKYINQT